MSQKRADHKKYIDTRQAVWDAIRAQRVFTVKSVTMETRLGMDTVRDYVTGLTAAGYVEETGHESSDAGYPAKTFKLVRDGGVDAPKVKKDGSRVMQGRGREQMWLVMRIIKEFSVKDLAIQASTEECIIAVVTAAEYCQFLARAGYLTRKKNGRYLFRPAMFTGPKAPMIQRVKQLFDPNLGQVVWSGKGGEK